MSSVRFCLFVLVLHCTTASASSSDSSFCLCALKDLLEDYALFSVSDSPPRYRSKFFDDIGFFIGVASHWKPVNNATWMDISSLIRSPQGIYSHISLDGRTSVNDGLLLNGVRSAFLAELITAYRSILNQVNQFHERVISSRSNACLQETRDPWRRFFR